MMARPLAAFGFTYLLAALGSLLLPTPTCLGLGILFGALGILAQFSRRDERHAATLLLLAAGVACVSVALADTFTLGPARRLAGETADLEGVVVEVRGENSAVVRLTNGVVLELASRETLGARNGDWFRAGQVKLERYDAGSNATYLRQRARLVPLRGFAAGACEFTPPRNGVTRWVSGLRERMSQGLRSRLSGYQGDVLAGMLLGERFRIDPALRADYQAAGIAHLLSISGCHIGMLTAFLRGLLRRLRFGPRASSLLTGVGILLYMTMVGFTPSVVRAGVMCLLFLASGMVRRSRDAYTSLALSGLLICLPNPFAVADAGFQMSFAATLGILVLQAPIGRWLESRAKRARWLRVREATVGVVALSLASALFLLPVIALSGSSLSPYSLIANVLIAPMIPVAIVGGLAAMLLGLLPYGAVLAAPFALAAGMAVTAISSVASLLALLPLASLPTGADFVVLWMAGAGIMVFAATRRPTRSKTRICAALCVITLMVGVGSYQLTLRGVVQATVFRTDGASAMVVVKEGRAAVIGDIRSKSDAIMLREVLGRYSLRSVDLLALWQTPRARNAAVADVLGPYRVHTAVLPEQDLEDERMLGLLGAEVVLPAGAWELELFGGDRLLLEPGAALGEWGGIKTFLLTGDCDILSCMMREGIPDVAVLTGGVPENLGRLRCAGLISNGVVGGVGPDLSARVSALSEQQPEASFLAKEGRIHFFF